MFPPVGIRKLILSGVLGWSVCVTAAVAAAQENVSSSPAYLAVVEGTATLERDGDIMPAVRDMPFVAGDRLRTANGRVEIDFPDGTAIEVGSYSEVEALSDTRVRLVAGTMDHLARRPVPSASASYLPTDLRSYGPTFDQYGSWNYDASFGYVWYPTVAADWRPYYYGSWTAVPSFGWTWIGLDAWSWPTHHYGRWGFARNAWFWIPGRTWRTAWVSWGVSPDYVSWCPLGYDGNPVFARSVGAAARAARTWTVVSRDHFGYRGHYVHRDAIDPRQFDARTPFVQTTHLPLAFGRDRDKVGSRASATKPAIENRQVPPPTRVAPPASAGVVAMPPGSAPGAPRRDSRIGTGDPKSGTTQPRVPRRGAATTNSGPTTGNRYVPAVPPAPRAVEPVVPPVSSPVVPPAGKPVIAPIAPHAPAPPGRIESGVPGHADRPAPIKVEPLRAQPVTRERIASPPPPPPAPPPPPPATPSRGAGAPTGKSATAPAKRPR